MNLSQRQKRSLILILGFIAMLGPLSIDMYLPGFRAIAEDLNTDIAAVSLTLTSYFIGISLGQLVYGPLLDRYGRLRPMLVGISIYLLAALASAASPSINWLIGSRFFMALGGCSGMVATRAIIRDRFEGAEIARVFSTLILIMGVAPIIAPTLGGYVVAALGWRSIFFILAGVAVAMLVLIHYGLSESKATDKGVSLRLRPVLRGYQEVLLNSDFLLYGLAGSLGMAGLFTYISGSPFVLMELYGLNEQTYGWVFGSNAAFFIMGSQINNQILKKYDTEKITKISAVALLAVGVLIALATFWQLLPYQGFLGLLMAFMFCLGFVNPNTMALSLLPFKRNAGMASALNGALRMLSGAIASALMGLFHDGSARPMFLLMTGFAALVFVLVYLAGKSKSLPQAAPA